MPAVIQLHEDPLAVCAQKAQVAVSRGQEAVDAHMALGHHGVEHPAHPGGGGERGLVRGQACAGAQDMAMGSQDLQLLGLQHHVPVAAGKKGEQSAVFPFFLAELPAEEIRDFGLVKIQGCPAAARC